MGLLRVPPPHPQPREAEGEQECRGGFARIVSYLSMGDLKNNPGTLPRWGEIAKALRAA